MSKHRSKEELNREWEYKMCCLRCHVWLLPPVFLEQCVCVLKPLHKWLVERFSELVPSFPAAANRSTQTSCERHLSLIQSRHLFRLLKRSSPVQFKTQNCPSIPAAFDYSYYHKSWLSLSTMRMPASVSLSIYLSLDLFLRQHTFHLHILTLLLLEACLVIYHGTCVEWENYCFPMCVYALCDLSVFDHTRSFIDPPRVPPGRPETFAGHRSCIPRRPRWRPTTAEQKELGYTYRRLLL